jgi:hypothetical protein
MLSNFCSDAWFAWPTRKLANASPVPEIPGWLGPRKFAEVHRLDIPALVAQLNSIGLRGLIQHAFGRRELSPCFTRFHCFCGFRTAWYRMEPDARATLHHHIERREVAA